MNRFRRLGLQLRIMLYVTVGLAVMFGVLAFLGLGAIDQATQLVFQERLSTAYTTAGILASDLGRTATEVEQASHEIAGVGSGTVRPGDASAILTHLEQADLSPFFGVTGIWLLSPAGDLLDQAGNPGTADAPPGAGRSLVAAIHDSYAVLPAVGPVPGAVSFAAVAVRLNPADAAGSPVAIVHTTSINSQAAYVPALYGRAGSPPAPVTAQGSVAESYHLEVVAPDGIAVLGIGLDERPGQISPHYPAIKSLMAQGGAAARLHEPGPADTFAPHVMAVVPLPSSPFYVVLEQPVDTALALPLQLRYQLVLTTAFGFLAALLLAWVTTRRVVKPTEQLTAAAERMALGDLASPIAISAQDEVGKLAESLDAMRKRLRDAYEAIEGTNRELERRVGERTARLGQLLRQTISAQEDERYRLARELHDETAQTLAALSVALDRARDGLSGAPPGALEQIGQAREIAARLLAETRRLIMGLRPAVLDDMGLLPAIRWYAETTLGDAGVAVEIEVDQAPPRLPAHIEVALFRIVQEAITNIAKHAEARHVTIRLSFDGDGVTVGVADDGRGFDVDRALGLTAPGTESVGLLGMQERVRLLNGRMEIHSTEGGGTSVSVRAPIDDEGG